MKPHRLLPFVVALALAAPASAQLVVVDPGHGGSDPGAVGCAGLEEAPSVLDVGQRLQVLLEGAGLRAELTRDDDRFVGLSARASFANSLGADLYVSVHSNANGGTPASGTETWIANAASSTSVRMAGLLQEEMVATWGLPDRGVKRADFTVIASTRMPAALTELAFTNRCDPDAMLLRDAGERMRIAEAHARAVLRTLGRDPSAIGGTGGVGVLQGVVFEDVGVGLEDTTRRLGGATVRVGDASVSSGADTGAFSFDLAPGEHTVTASLAGFEMASRGCEVTAGGETWCSIGLTRADAPPPADAGAPPSTEDAGTMTEETDAQVVPVAPDAGTGGPDRPGPVAGCAAAPMPSSGRGPLGLLFVVALLALLRGVRFRRLLLLSAMMLSACGRPELGASGEALGEPATAETTAAETTATETTAAEMDGAPIIADLVAPFARLVDERPVAADLTAPVISGDGRHLAMTNRDRDALWLADLRAGTVEAIAEGPRVGYRPVFVDGRLRYRHADQSPTAIPHHAVDLGDVAAALDRGDAGLHVRLDDRHRVVLHDGRSERLVSPEGDRYLEPSVSPDGRHVVFWGMATGVHLHRVADGARVAIGAGGHPQISGDGRWLVFDRTEDDGHLLTAGELFLTDLRDPGYRTAPITDTPDRIEQSPTLAGDTIAFATDDGVLTATLSLD